MKYKNLLLVIPAVALAFTLWYIFIGYDLLVGDRNLRWFMLGMLSFVSIFVYTMIQTYGDD